ncbi:hypothetical protein T07_9640 [Trichinella nelsoni]|uniref:Uncharacterized protein n=1 Tax=Trichinella nelsoni TaxID=6336 RepID=A0A0V0RWG1_9BILA|nr:hypothetical protein T07_9640 [Trichinella nelsoni]
MVACKNKMDNDKNHIGFIFLICSGTISAIGQFILLCFLLYKKKKSIIFILIVALVATNCVNAISVCFIGIFNSFLFDQHGTNFTTPRCCILYKPYYLISIISSKQSPVITCAIGVIQLQHACSMKWERRKLLSKCLAYFIFMLITCIFGVSTFYNMNVNLGIRRISTMCLHFEVFPRIEILWDTIIILLLNSLSMLLYILAVLIIRSKLSSSHAIREIQYIRQKAILRRFKIIVSAQLLYSCTYALSVFTDIQSFPTLTAYYLWCFFPLLKAGNSIVYADIAIPVMDKFEELCHNLRKLLNSVNMHTKKHNTGLYAVIINLVIHRRNTYRMCIDGSTIEEQFQDSKMITTFINAEYDLMMSVFSL